MPMLNRWYSHLFNIYAPVYDLIGRRFTRERRMALERLPMYSGMDVLVAGCGTGIDLEWVPPDIHVWMADVSPEMLLRAVRRAGAFGLSYTAMVDDITRPDWFPQKVDGIIVHFTLTLLAHPQEFWRNTACTVPPGGWVSVLDWFGPIRLPVWVQRSTAAVGWAQGVRVEDILPDAAGWDIQEGFSSGSIRHLLVKRTS